MFVDALTALAKGFWSLGLFRFMTGTGTGMELPVGTTFVTESVNNGWRARLLALMGVGYPAGYVLAIGSFATIGGVWGWRGVFVASIIPGLAVFFIRLKVAESPRFQLARERLARGEVKRDRVANITVFRKPYVRDALPAVVYWIGNAFAFWAFYTFIPLYLVNVRQMSTSVELTWLATFQVWAVVMTYLGSWLSDRWGRRPLAPIRPADAHISLGNDACSERRSALPRRSADIRLQQCDMDDIVCPFHRALPDPHSRLRYRDDAGLRTDRVDSRSVVLWRGGSPIRYRDRLSPRRPCLDPHDCRLSLVARDERG
jgi:hypothetical protein